MNDRFKEMDVLQTSWIGGEGSDPGRAVKALASSLQGKGGLRLMARAGDKLTITVEKNDRVPHEDRSFPALEWKASATIGPAPASPPASNTTVPSPGSIAFARRIFAEMTGRDAVANDVDQLVVLAMVFDALARANREAVLAERALFQLKPLCGMGKLE